MRRQMGSGAVLIPDILASQQWVNPGPGSSAPHKFFALWGVRRLCGCTVARPAAAAYRRKSKCGEAAGRRDQMIGAFSGKVDFRFSAENATTQTNLERVPRLFRIDASGTRSSVRRRFAWASFAAIGAWMLAGGAAATAQECKNRGQLDSLYCDENNDLVADVPTDPKKLKDPSTLVFAYTPVEDPAVYQNVFKPFTEFLGQCTGKRVVYYPVQSNSAEIEAMRSGRLHVAGFSTGPTGFAVNMAGPVPFAAKGTEKGPQGYHLLSIVRKDSPYQKLSDLKGKRVAHTAPSSNSGHLAPLVLYPPEGLQPNVDYKPLMSGGHDNSALGVLSGDYDMAGVASDVFERMIV